MATRKLADFDTPEGFRKFLLARGLATADDVAATLDLSRASYYRLVDMFVARLYGSPDSTRGKDKVPTVAWFHEALLEAVEHHPDWGCYRLAENLSAIRKISGPTVQRELARLNLGTRDERFAHKEKITLDKSGQFANLGEEAQRELIKNNPRLTDLALIEGRYNIHLFAACLLKLPNVSSKPIRFLVLLVSLNTSVVFLEDLDADNMSEAQGFARSRVKSIINSTPRLSSLPSEVLVSENFEEGFRIALTPDQSLRISRTPKSKIPASLKALIKRVKKEVADRYLDMVNTEGVGVARAYLDSWASQHNNRPRLGFPTFGISPLERMKTFAQSEK